MGRPPHDRRAGQAVGCTVTAAGLRVYPPNQFTSKVVPYPLGACVRTGPVWMHAGPVQEG
jgi:hypothetical protein